MLLAHTKAVKQSKSHLRSTTGHTSRTNRKSSTIDAFAPGAQVSKKAKLNPKPNPIPKKTTAKKPHSPLTPGTAGGEAGEGTADKPFTILKEDYDVLQQGLADQKAEVAELKRQLAEKGKGKEGNTENKGGNSKPAGEAPAPGTQVVKSNSSAEQPREVTEEGELQRKVEKLNKIKHLLSDGEYTKQIQGFIDRSLAC
jgi:hypothetical protein